MKGAVAVRLRQPAIRKRDASSAPPARVRGSDLAPLAGEDRELFETLRKWRRAEAEQRGVPPYVIFGDKTLRELARVRPSTLTELRGIYGIGDAKLEAFGTAILAQIGGR
jgi:ATP-dependent DNA helicase RecQ